MEKTRKWRLYPSFVRCYRLPRFTFYNHKGDNRHHKTQQWTKLWVKVCLDLQRSPFFKITKSWEYCSFYGFGLFLGTLWPRFAFFSHFFPFYFQNNTSKPKWNKLIWNRERKWTRSVHCPYCASYTSVYPKTLTILN